MVLFSVRVSVNVRVCVKGRVTLSFMDSVVVRVSVRFALVLG